MVPLAPFTSPASVHRLIVNITRDPTDSHRQLGRPSAVSADAALAFRHEFSAVRTTMGTFLWHWLTELYSSTAAFVGKSLIALSNAGSRVVLTNLVFSSLMSSSFTRPSLKNNNIPEEFEKVVSSLHVGVSVCC
jgi:hypothetical protein